MKRRFLLLMMAVCTLVSANAAIKREQNYLSASNATVKQGQSVEVTLTLKNALPIINWKATLVLAEGMDGTTVSVPVAAERWTSPIVESEGAWFSETETAVAAGEGVVAKFTITVPKDLAVGTYTLQLVDELLTAEGGSTVDHAGYPKTFTLTVEEGSEEGVPGDITGDNDVTVADVSALLTIIANSGTATEYPAADVTGDGEVTVADLSALLTIIANKPAE
ncbi:MAG: hypothetical protein IKO73_08725 [Bacteroidaceae bacterium]|nr:hypothetical protein [Bacteroidaceae bacterium]